MRGSPDNDDLVPLHEPFETALRGFNRRQVLEHLESLDGRIAMVTADRDSALTQVAELSKVLNHLRLESELLGHLRREAEQATSRLDRVLASPMTEGSARIQRILQLAEEEAAELKANAEVEIAARIAHADQDIADQRVRADDQINRLRARASREAKALLERARRQCDKLEADSAARRAGAEQEAAQVIMQRESAANKQIRDSELSSIARLYLMIQVICGQLTARASTVHHDESALRELRAQVASEVTALEVLRTEVTTSLAGTYQLLVKALGQVHRVLLEASPAERSEIASSPGPVQPPMPIQRSADGGTVYLLNAGTDDRRPPRPPR